MSIGLALLLSVTPPSGDVVAPAPGPAAPPPSAAPTNVAPPPSPAPDTVGNASSTADEVREQVGELASGEPASEPDPEPQSGPSSGSVIYVDYSNTWQEVPPSTIVVTEVVHDPYHPPPPIEPVSADEEPRVHGFVGLSLRGTATNSNPSALTGGRLGFVFDDRFMIGGAFYSLTARYAGPIVDPMGRELGMRMAYGGVLLAWTLYKGRVVDVGVESLAAAGAACISQHKRSVGRWSCIEKVGLVSIEPGLRVGFTLTDWVRVGMTAGYRFVTREAWRPPNDFTLSGPYVGLDIDFGAFRGNR